MTNLTITSQPLTPATIVCALSGELDPDGFEPLGEEFDKYLHSGIRGVVLDMSGLESFTSAGLGAILNMSRALREREGRLVLACPKPEVLGTIAMLGLQDAVPIADSLDAAKKLLADIRV